MVPLTSPYLKFNADGTSFQTGGGLTDLVKVKYLPDDWEAKDGRPFKVEISLILSAHARSRASVVCSAFPSLIPSSTCILLIDR